MLRRTFGGLLSGLAGPTACSPAPKSPAGHAQTRTRIHRTCRRRHCRSHAPSRGGRTRDNHPAREVSELSQPVVANAATDSPHLDDAALTTSAHCAKDYPSILFGHLQRCQRHPRAVYRVTADGVRICRRPRSRSATAVHGCRREDVPMCALVVCILKQLYCSSSSTYPVVGSTMARKSRMFSMCSSSERFWVGLAPNP